MADEHSDRAWLVQQQGNTRIDPIIPGVPFSIGKGDKVTGCFEHHGPRIIPFGEPFTAPTDCLVFPEIYTDEDGQTKARIRNWTPLPS
jgi:hypothetical protein